MVSSGIPVKYWWHYQWFLVVYQWKSAVKFGGITSGFQWYTSKILVALPVVSSGIPVERQWYTSGNQLFIFGGITTVIH